MPAAPDTDEMSRLVCWTKIDLKPGETRHISITAEPRRLAAFDIAHHGWHIEAGDYTVRLAESATDPGTSVTVKLDQRDMAP